MPPGVVLVVVVVVVSATTSPRSLDGALDDNFLVGGSTDGPRETLRFRAVVSSGEANAAFCDRVAGIMMVRVGSSWVCGGVADGKRGVVEDVLSSTREKL